MAKYTRYKYILIIIYYILFCRKIYWCGSLLPTFFRLLILEYLYGAVPNLAEALNTADINLIAVFPCGAAQIRKCGQARHCMIAARHGHATCALRDRKLRVTALRDRAVFRGTHIGRVRTVLF